MIPQCFESGPRRVERNRTRERKELAAMTHDNSAHTCSSLLFPSQSIVGSIGDLARLLAQGTEVPEEFYFASGLTVLGSICAVDLRLKIGLTVSPRLYTVLLGESYAVKKSTAQNRVIEVFESIVSGS